MAKLGRNGPCPCGSGKKYKKCCRARHEALLTKEGLRLRDLAEDLMVGLHEFTDRNLTRAELSDARLAFLGMNEEPLLDADAEARAEEDGEDHAGRFVLDWLIFTRREGAGGPTPTYLERFLAAEGTTAGAATGTSAGPTLTQEHRDLLAAWQASYRGIFEVEAVFPGVSLVLKDIYTDETTEVADTWVSARVDLAPGDLLYARPLKAKPFDRLAPGTLPLDPWWLPRFEGWYEEAADRLLQGDPQPKPQVAHVTIMNAEAHTLHRLVLELLLHLAMGDFEGDLEEDLEEESDDDLDDALARELFGDDDPKGGETDDGADDDVNDDNDVDCDDDEAAGRGDEDLVRKATEVVRDFYRKWVDEPQAELDGLTPRQAWRTPSGRAALDKILRLMVTGHSQSPSSLSRLLDLDFLRQLLDE